MKSYFGLDYIKSNMAPTFPFLSTMMLPNNTVITSCSVSVYYTKPNGVILPYSDHKACLYMGTNNSRKENERDGK